MYWAITRGSHNYLIGHDLSAYSFSIIYRNDKNITKVDALIRYPLKSESDSDDGIRTNEVKTISIEAMFVNKFCCEESFTFSANYTDS